MERKRNFLSSRFTFSESFSKCSKDYYKEYLYPFMIFYEESPSSINYFASERSSPARRTTEVVPSPTSSSYDLAISTRVLAAGWIISNNSKIEAPSLVIYVSLYNLINLSIPLGPFQN